jgi:hypothetical protein
VLLHVNRVWEDKLRGNTEKEVILQDIGELHSMLTQEEFDMKVAAMFNCWLVSSSTFALYFYQQRVQGEFTEWQIYCSTPEVSKMNNAVESLNTTIKKYFTCHKWFKLGKYCFIIMHDYIGLYSYINICNIFKLF